MVSLRTKEIKNLTDETLKDKGLQNRRDFVEDFVSRGNVIRTLTDGNVKMVETLDKTGMKKLLRLLFFLLGETIIFFVIRYSQSRSGKRTLRKHRRRF